MTWHADQLLLENYLVGDLDDVHALSLEAHLLACQPCRLRLARLADRPRLDAVWNRVTASVDEPKRTAVERVLVWLGVREHVARLIAATPSLSGAWVLAVALCLVFAVVAANIGSWGSTAFVALAPLLPVAGVAVAYGPWLDPVYELSLAAPVSNFTLLLLRASATLASTVVLAAVAALALPGPWWLAAAWLLPAFALTLATLALSSYVPQAVAASLVGLAWIAVVAPVPALADDRLAAFRLGGQATYVAVGLVAVIVLARRRDTFEQGRLNV
jgi:hypothetical protein